MIHLTPCINYATDRGRLYIPTKRNAEKLLLHHWSNLCHWSGVHSGREETLRQTNLENQITESESPGIYNLRFYKLADDCHSSGPNTRPRASSMLQLLWMWMKRMWWRNPGISCKISVVNALRMEMTWGDLCDGFEARDPWLRPSIGLHPHI